VRSQVTKPSDETMGQRTQAPRGHNLARGAVRCTRQYGVLRAMTDGEDWGARERAKVLVTFRGRTVADHVVRTMLSGPTNW
jgi:hypothetical protein